MLAADSETLAQVKLLLLSTKRRWRGQRDAADLRRDQNDLVYVAPAPGLARLERADERVAGLVRVGGRVPVGRVVAAADETALQADSQMKPRVASLQAGDAAVHSLRKLGDPDLIAVSATGHLGRV
jgi:hypothetical protein